MKFAPLKPTPRGFGQRTPPAAFPAILGLFGLGVGWRLAAGILGLPAGPAELVLGIVTLLFLIAFAAYAAKFVRRPSVLAEDLRILPGRGGLAAGVLCVYLLAITLIPHAPGLARVVLIGGLVLHLAFAGMVLAGFARGPAEQRRGSPVWHLIFVGAVIAVAPAVELGLVRLAQGLYLWSLLAALVIWAASLEQFRRNTVPAPLRPLLVIHLTPANFLGIGALALGWPSLATAFGFVTVAMVLLLAGGALWLTRAGFSPFWSSFTFPTLACAKLWLLLSGVDGAWLMPGIVLLVAASVITLPIAAKVLQSWFKGQLAQRTNAAAA